MTPTRYLILLLLLFVAPLAGQPSPVFPAERHAELREELPYTPEEEPEEEVPTDEPPAVDWERVQDVLTKFAWLFVISGLLLLAYFLLRHFKVGFFAPRRVEAPVARVEAEEIVEEEMVREGVELSLIERAEGAGQYDVAVRLHYIALLKSLQDGGYIRYRRDYSNRDYRRQLSGNPLQADFTEVTKLYERYWYGEYPLDRLGYRLVSRKFFALSDRLALASAPNPSQHA